ncbi:hypothetical protein BJX68DRAFT_242217, partial [Aspergillus pseudodeflectus]
MITLSGGLRVNVLSGCYPVYLVAFCVYILVTAVLVQTRVQETYRILLLSCLMHLLSLLVRFQRSFALVWILFAQGLIPALGFRFRSLAVNELSLSRHL